MRYSPEEYRRRPRDVDFAVADEVVFRISNGELLPAVCDDIDMPLPGVFLQWCEDDPDLSERYRRARLRGADVNFDEAVIAADHPDPARAGALSRALMWHTQLASPDKYAPRTVQRNVKEKPDDEAGFDPGADLRRRIDAMAARRADEGRVAEAGAQDPSEPPTPHHKVPD